MKVLFEKVARPPVMFETQIIKVRELKKLYGCYGNETSEKYVCNDQDRHSK